jgi:DNA adenine methylase
LISNHDLPLTRALYQGADFSMLSVKRSISQNGAKRQPVDEILAYFPPATVMTKRSSRNKKATTRNLP